MTEDATYEDGDEAPLNLKAFEAEDLQVISALCQDAVFPGTEISWNAKARRFALLLNRYRWEDKGRRTERVRSILAVDDVLKVSTQGVARDADMVFAILSLAFEPGEDGTGALILTLSGDGAIRLGVEALDVTLKDVTRPYRAPSKKRPSHDDAA